MTSPKPAEEALRAASGMLRALGAPHRLAIVVELAAGPRRVHELTRSLGASQSLTSQHLRVLRTSGLVVGLRRGKEMSYSLADEHVTRIALDAVKHASEPSTARRWAASGGDDGDAVIAQREGSRR